MATARRIITRALRLIQVLAAGETAPAADAQDSLDALNDMLALGSTSNLIVPYMTRESISVATSPVALAVRPMRIVGAWINDGANDLPLRLISQDEYLGITNKGFQGLPASLRFDQLYPVAAIYLYPVPVVAYAVTLDRWDRLTEVPTLETEVALPGEYREMLASNLALRLAPEFGVAVSAELASMAKQSLDLVQTFNAEPVPTLGCEVQSTRRRYGLNGTDSLALFRSGLL